MTRPAVSIIVCSRNRAESLRRVLEALVTERSGMDDVEILAVNNASTDDTRSVAEQMAARTPGLRYLEEPRQGKAFALNTGLRAAKGDLLCFTDDDVTIGAGWLTALRECFRDGTCEGAAGRILPAFEGGVPAWLPERFPFPFRYDFGVEAGEAQAPAFGANMAYRRRAFEKHGAFREDLGPSSGNPFGLGEDSEFCGRLLKAGERVRYVPGAVVHHPVTREQASKRFLCGWHVRLGRALARREPVSAGTPRIFGAPRYLFRTLIESSIGWLCAVNQTRRLSRSLELCRTWGAIVEYRTGRP